MLFLQIPKKLSNFSSLPLSISEFMCNFAPKSKTKDGKA